MPTALKVRTVEALRERFGDVSSAILTEYRGLTVGQLAELRRQLKAVSADYTVVKNTLAKRAIRGSSLEKVSPYLTGPTGLAYSGRDAVALAKALQAFQRANPNLQIKAGYVEGAVLPAEGVRALAELPPKEVLLAQMLGAFQGPIAGLVTTLEGVLRRLVSVLDQIRASRESGLETDREREI